MLPAGQHVRDTYLGANGIIENANAGTLLIDSSTIDVETSRAVAAAAEKKGLLMIDAPVSGGVGGATAGTLTFMVGGPEAVFAKARPILEKMGKNIVHAGTSGSGQAAKICNNMILGVSMVAVCEGFMLGKRLGLYAQKLFNVVSTASGSCWSLFNNCTVPGPVPGPVPTSPANRDYQAGFTAAMMLKDLLLAQQAASAAGATTPLGAEAAQLFSLFVNGGNGGKDFSGIIRMLDGK
jgi:3-hydroxyisobutyrate dehydrogenase